MKISEAREENVIERKLYLGMENFHPVAVNPTKQELIDMGINATEEPVYVQKVKRDFDKSGTEKEYEQVSIRVFLDNKDENNRIRTQVSFNIVRDFRLSQSGKYEVLNKYGTSTWLEEKFIGAGDLPANMQWYLNEDVKKALRGEALLVEFIKALYNLPYINDKSTQDTKEKGVAVLTDADLDKLFKGDFSDMRKLIAVNAKDQKVGFLLGVRNVEGNWRQNLFVRSPQKSYVAKTNKTERLVKDVIDAQENGAYADAIFDLNNTKLKEFNPDADTATPTASVGGTIVEDDDLPF